MTYEILVEDFSAKLGREDIFKPTIGNVSLHKIGNDNGFIVICPSPGHVLSYPVLSCLTVYLPIFLSNLSIYLICLPVRLSPVNPPIYLPTTHPSTSLPTCLSVYVRVHLSTRLPVRTISFPFGIQCIFPFFISPT
jgi:hypothetical protein